MSEYFNITVEQCKKKKLFKKLMLIYLKLFNKIIL